MCVTGNPDEEGEMPQRDVVVNGVTVPMHRQEPGEKTRPLRMAIGLLEIDPSASFGGAPREDAEAAIRALRDAGVKWLPLVEDEAREAGVKWQEVC
jgi:hypothetical protein